MNVLLQTKAQRLWPVTGESWLSQAWVWTRTAWFNLISDKKQQAFGTPLQSTTTPHNIISSSTHRVRSTVAVRGEICFRFTASVVEKTTQMLLYFSHYCSLIWIFLRRLFSPVSSPSVHVLKGSHGDCVPLLLHKTSAQQNWMYPVILFSSLCSQVQRVSRI